MIRTRGHDYVSPVTSPRFISSLATLSAVFLAAAVLLSCSDLIIDPDLPPVIDYDSPMTFTVGVADSQATLSTGGPVAGYAIAPALPAGLKMDTSTGSISGVALEVSPEAQYAVIAAGPGGNDTALILLRVVALPIEPGTPRPQIAYASPVTDTAGKAAEHAVISTGGPITGYSLSPSLPAGLSLNGSTGMISGTPAQVTGMATYTVIAYGPGGKDTASIAIAIVGNSAIPRPSIAYASPVTDTVGRPAAHAVISSGGPVTTYSQLYSDDVLADVIIFPPGLALNPATGMISGTPTTATGSLTYRILATGPGGKDTATITINVVQPVAPPSITYASPVTDTVGRPAAHAVISTGGPVTGYSVSPALPAGLTLNTVTGLVSGTPSASLAANTYSLIAQGPGGRDTATLTLEVVAAPASAPTPLAYWDFNEGTGTVLTDRTGGGRNAVISGATWTAGIAGGALRFDGVDDFAESASSLPDMARQTMMAWVFLESVKESYLFGEGDNSSGRDNTLGIRPTTARFLYRTHDADPGDQHLSRQALQTGTWHHLVGVSTGDSVLLYLDGQRDTVYTGRAFNLNGFHHRLQFGRFNDGGGGRLYFHGRLDEIKVFSVALTPAQIQAEWFRHAAILLHLPDPSPLPRKSAAE
jgi:hypothetical protein